MRVFFRQVDVLDRKEEEKSRMGERRVSFKDFHPFRSSSRPRITAQVEGSKGT